MACGFLKTLLNQKDYRKIAKHFNMTIMDNKDKKKYPPTAEESIAEDAQRKENSQSDHSSFGYDNEEGEAGNRKNFDTEEGITRNDNEDFKTD